MTDYLSFVDHPDSVWDNTLGLDYMSWDDVHELSSVKMTEESSLEYSKDLPREAFLGLYNPSTTLAEKQTKGLETVHSLMNRAQQMPEFQDLRRTVQGDQWACAAGSSTFVYEFLDKLPEDVKKAIKEQQQAQNNAQNAQNQLSAFQQMMAGGQGQAGNNGNSGQAQGQGGAGSSGGSGSNITEQQLQDALNQAQSKLDAANQAAQDAINKNTNQIDNSLAKSMRNAEDTLKDMKDNQRALGWSLNGGGHLNKQNVEHLQKMSELMKGSRYLKKVIDMLGWANQLMRSELKKKVRGREQLVDYTRQELDLDFMAPEEWIAFASPEDSPLHQDWTLRAVDKGVLHMHFDGEEPKGKGPCIILKDTSGSMMGDPFATATALEYVIMNQMIKDNRRFCSIPFSGMGQFEVYDPGPKPDIDKLLDHMGFGYWCGTEPYAPLSKAVEIICKDASFKEGYILILTDGSFGTPPDSFIQELNKARQNPGVKVVAVVIGAYPGAADFADKVITLDNLFSQRDELAPALSFVL